MGIAEVIPGVSGGTIALITGIYPKLIDTITGFNLDLLKNIRSHGWKGLNEGIDLRFLISLIMGMVLGLLFGIFFITYLYENYPEPLWGFFFGLILASSAYIGLSIKGWKVKEAFILILGIAIAYGVTVISPASGTDSYIYIFISGMLAITALILPGISGSFILLLLGMYTLIIPTLKSLITDFSMSGFMIIGVFALGCLIGLFGFARVLKYLFKHYERSTLVLLTGFMIGSLNKIWPWRNPVIIVDKITGNHEWASREEYSTLDAENFKVLVEKNVLPADYWVSDPMVFWTILSFSIGLLSIALFSLLQKK